MKSIVLLDRVVADLEVVRDQAARIVTGLSERTQDQASIAYDVDLLSKALDETRLSIQIARAQLDGQPAEIPEPDDDGAAEIPEAAPDVRAPRTPRKAPRKAPRARARKKR